MLKKVIVLIAFGRPFGWEDKLIANCNGLEKYGWHWLAVTDIPIESKGNFKVLPMTMADFNALIFKKFGAVTDFQVTEKNETPPLGFTPTWGYLLSEHLKDADFWGMAGFDVVCGRLDKYLPDEFLKDIDIFGNDPDAINGAFSLLRNNDYINTLFMVHPDWRRILTSDSWLGFDETGFSEIVRKEAAENKIRFKSAFWQEHDKMELHYPPQLKIFDDGSLFNTITGDEMMIFHFRRTKEWPLK